MADNLNNLENDKLNLEIQLNEVLAKAEKTTLTEEAILKAFEKVKTEFNNGTLRGMKEIINLFVNKVVVYQDRVEVILSYGSDLLKLVAEDYNSKASALRFYFDGIITVYADKKRKHNFFQNCVFSGGEGLCLPNCKFFFTIPVTIEMILYRSREIEDLLHINNVPF